MARPLQAAIASALTFSSGAMLPLLIALVSPAQNTALLIAGASLLFLVGLGLLAARVGGAPPFRAALRVGLWGALAMAVTAGIGSLFGTAV
jgi:VIT1/CCC1 family predicted Fe2+/Mn2+ transporter